jgi:arylsulfatase A-like enzyme/Tfp pilus assembly protein PilF
MRVVALFALLQVASATAGAERPSVVLVTLDTTRADRMGFLGSKRGLTPRLDALAAGSVVFDHAYSQAPITTASHATILTGTYPPFHGVTDFGAPLPASVPYLPEVLKTSGYKTAAFVGSLILDPKGGFAPGFDRGFDVFDAGFRARRAGEDRYGTVERRGSEVVARAARWLAESGPGPVFIWVHLYDAHDPYDPPAPFRERFTAAPYDGEIAALDGYVGQLIDTLADQKRLDGAVLAICADHGEALGDHGEDTHGVFLYDETIHVPLVVKLPGGRDAGRRASVRAGLVDLAPTLLEVAGEKPPAAMQGESLLPWIAGRAPERPAYSETSYTQRAFGWSPLAAWRAERFLLVKAPHRELYDVVADPGALTNLAETRGQVADRMTEILDAARQRWSGSAAAASAVDPELKEKLAALGYVSGGSSTSASGVDPKDRIAVANTLHTAILDIENAQYAAAEPLLEKAAATDPQITAAQLQLGIARARLKKPAQAIPPLRKAIELQPDSMVAQYEMGLVLFETGDWKTSAKHFEIVTGKRPRWADARFSYGSVLARIDRVPEAVRELEATLELEPGHYRANLLLGRILDLQRNSGEAIAYLLRAAAAQPNSAEAHVFLADAYEHAGRSEDAARERTLVKR